MLAAYNTTWGICIVWLMVSLSERVVLFNKNDDNPQKCTEINKRLLKIVLMKFPVLREGSRRKSFPTFEIRNNK